jgi:hypothetical protein
LAKAKKFDENNNIALGTENARELSRIEKFIDCFNLAENKKALNSKESSMIKSISGMRYTK